MASHDQPRGSRRSKLSPIERNALNAKQDIQDAIFRMAERSGFPAKAAQRALKRHLDEMVDDIISEVERERSRKAPKTTQ
jgi:hypothetical protein